MSITCGLPPLINTPRLAASRFRPRNRQGLTTMVRAHDSGDIGFHQGGELAGIKVTPFTMSVIMYGARLTAGWTGQVCVFRNADNDRH